MDLRSLKHLKTHELCAFVALAETLRLAPAAARLGIRVSSLRKPIKALEKSLRGELFSSTPRGTTLTERGARLLPQVRDVLAGLDRVFQDAAALAGGRHSRLRIGISCGLPMERVARLLEESERAEGAIEFSIEPRALSDQIRALESGQLDVGLAMSLGDKPVAEDGGLRALRVHREPVLVAMQAGHPLTRQAAIHALAGVGPWVVVGEDSAGAGELAKLLGTEDAVHYVPSVDWLVMRVLAGRGVGLLGAEQARSYGDTRMALRPLGAPKLWMGMYALTRREEESAVVRRFLERSRRVF